jgi:autotransporter translocation and assembly factor TamB
MKTRVFLAMLLLVLVLVVGALSWLLGTAEGARWIMERLFRALPVAVHTERISGALANTLYIEGLRIDSPDWEVSIRTTSLSCQPLYLLLGNVVLKEVALHEIVLTDRHPEAKQPIDMTWPRIPPSLTWFKGWIGEVRIDDLMYRKGNTEPLIVDSLRTAVDWQAGTLVLRNLTAQSSLGSLEGFIMAGFSRPSLKGNFKITLTNALADQDSFSFSVKLLPADTPEQVAGSVALTAASRQQERFHAEGNLGIARDRFIVRDIIVREAGRQGTMTATGEVLVSQPDPYVRLRLEANGIDLSGEFKFPALLSGTVNVQGNMHQYEGSFSLEQNSPAPSWRDVQAAGTFAGDRSQAVIRDMNGRFLSGTFKGGIALLWEKDQRLSWDLKTVNMDPSRLKADLQGRVNLNTTGFVRWSGMNLTEGDLKAKLIDSVFQHRILSGALDAHWRRGTLKVARCELHGRGLDFWIRGSPEEGLLYRFGVSESSNVLPVKGGPFTGNGVVRWEKGGLTGMLESRFVSVFSRVHASWVWNNRGLNVRAEMRLEKGGVVEGNFMSPQPVALTVPEEGTFELTWNSLDLKLLQERVPASLDLQGRLNGVARGRLLKDARFQTSVKTWVRNGRFSWEGDHGITSLEAERAETDFSWEGAAISGKIGFTLKGHGYMEGTYEIPLPAFFPLRMNPDGPLKIKARGEFREKGILSILFPGVIRESRGMMQFQLATAGTWKNPDWSGTATLSGASAQLPVTGLRLENGKAEAVWHQDRIRISSFQLRSGEGEIRGSADVWMKDWNVDRYEGRLTGEKFQAVYLPEVRIAVNPDLRFTGTMTGMEVMGDVMIHKAQIQQSEREGMVKASGDVVIVDRPQPKKAPSAFGLNTRVSVTLGEAFSVRAAGVDARLDGKVLVVSKNFDEQSLDGRISVAKGDYDRYGVKLDIHRGHLVFNGGPAQTGQLDILAFRTVRDNNRNEDVHAGVTITGPLHSPLIKLYSRPAMNDSDVLSYIVLGRPFKSGEEKDQQDLLLKAAGALLARSPSSGSLQRQLQDRLGIDSIDLESTTIGGVSHSLVTVGKYLSPNLYVAFGRSLFTSDYYMLTRYSFLKNWHIESKMGFQTGADLFYRIQFD